MNTDAMFSSKTDKWSTPQWFFDELNKEFEFDLDPCADETNHKCEKYFTEEQNGLIQNWGGAKCFAILRMAKKSASGLKSVITKSCMENVILWCCLSLQGQTQNGFTNTFTIRQKLDL